MLWFVNAYIYIYIFKNWFLLALLAEAHLFFAFLLPLECQHSDAVAGTLVPIRSAFAEIPG